MIYRQHLRSKTSNSCVGRKRTLVTGASTGTAELLGLATSVVGNKEGTVVRDEELLDVVLAVLIDELLVVGDNGLGDGLTDGVDLRSVSTTGDADTDVDTGELLEADDEERLVDLEAEDLRLHEVKGLAIDLEETATGLAVGNRSGCIQKKTNVSFYLTICRFPSSPLQLRFVEFRIPVFFLPKHWTD